MPKLFNEIRNWAEGVNTSAPSDAIPAGASPRGINTFLKSIGEKVSLVGKRRGAQPLNPVPVTGSPGVWGFQFKKKSGTKYNLLVSDTGRLDQLNSNGTLTTLNATAFTSGQHVPIFAVANDLCFIVNDVNQKKFDGTNVTKFGIDRPAAPAAVATVGGAMAAGVWDVALTYFNSVTGHESSRSDFTSVTLGGANLQITVTWGAPADTQVTHVRVYARQQATGQNAYRAVAGATPAADATYGGYTPATLSTVLNISAVQYAAFILIAPNTSENDAPLSGLKGPCWHQSRLFLFDSGNIYYSKVKNNAPFPEAFDPENKQPINPDDGDSVIGLRSFKGRLFVHKKFSLWSVIGSDPNSWDVAKVSDTPTSSMRSIVEADGNLYWWAGHLGLVGFSGDGTPSSLGKEFIANSITNEVLNENSLDLVEGGVDENNEMVLMAVPETNTTRNSRIVPFNYRLRRFAAEYWNPFDVKSLWSVEQTDDLKALYIGGYTGVVFQWWAASNDGVPTGTGSTGTVDSSTGTTLTDAGTQFSIGYAKNITDGTPAGYWRLGEAVGPTASDSSGNARNGTYVAAPTLGVAGAVGDGDKAVTLNGTTQYVTMGDVAALEFTTNFSIEAWAKFAGTPNASLAGKSAGTAGYLLYLDAGRVAFWGYTGAGVKIFDFHTTPSYGDSAYHQFGATFDGTTAIIYVDGVAITSAPADPGTIAQNAAVFSIGSLNTGAPFFGGTIDEVAVWGRLLTPTEFVEHYALRTTTQVGAGLIDRFVYAITSDRLTVERRRITTNTLHTLTITPAWDVNPNSTYTFAVGGIDFQLDTPWVFAPSPFVKKRYEFCFIEASSDDISVTLDIDFFVSMNDLEPKRSKTMMLGGTGGLYDSATSIYDTSTFAGSTVGFGKIRLASTGRAWKARIRNIAVDQDILIWKIAVQGDVLGIKQ